MGRGRSIRRNSFRRLRPLLLRPRSGKPPNRLAELGEKFPGAALVGCSTGGEIIGDEVLDNSLVASAVQFDRTAIHVAKVEIAGDTSRDVGKRLAPSSPR